MPEGAQIVLNRADCGTPGRGKVGRQPKGVEFGASCSVFRSYGLRERTTKVISGVNPFNFG